MSLITILLVSHNPYLLDQAQVALKQAGWTAHIACNLEDALLLAEHLPHCDLILLDEQGLTGPEKQAIINWSQTTWPEVICMMITTTHSPQVYQIVEAASILPGEAEVHEPLAISTDLASSFERALAVQHQRRLAARSGLPAFAFWLPLTKFQPPLPRPDLICRPELLDRLETAVAGHRLSLISAPVGYGKTTLVSQWLSHHQVTPPGEPNQPFSSAISCAASTAWLTLDPHDNTLPQFLLGVAATLSLLHPDCGQTLLSALRELPPQQQDRVERDLEIFVSWLVNDILTYLPQGMTLALDNYQVVTEPAIHRALSYLLFYLPPCARVVLITNLRPLLPLAQFRAQGQMAQFGPHDLAFNRAEIAAFLDKQARVPLPAAEIDLAYHYTGGWPAAVRLLAHHLKSVSLPPGHLMASLTRPQTLLEQDIFSYLAEEIFNPLPAETRQFSLESCLLPELSPLLCQAITSRANTVQLLGELYRRGLLERPDLASPQTYHYQSLFLHFLRRRLEQEMPERLADLQRQAAQAMRPEEDLPEAPASLRVEQAIPVTEDGETLTRREAQILALLAAGLTNRAIAERLDISIITVKSHITNLLHKLAVPSRREAVNKAKALGLFETSGQ